MTTNYTATVEITTPSVVLTDFTAVVPAALGVNVFGAATDADINTFDIGPTGDSNILLQTLAAGNHHVHGGVCHDSHTPSGPTYGVHGIYDKANGTLVEQMEFYNHPNGQGYSPRYGNSCYQSVFHDTPFSIGLFNYQGAAVGAGGTLRIRQCVFYNVPSGGYIFYSDGLWLESNGTILGDSLISVEIDHCTIDVRGVTQPFDFSQCHNDVYLTNCVVISDSGLPLSSIITPPTGGATVHLDGSIVLDSADAATYLGPAPTFTPIAVGGSPVIGTAGASPPGSFAEWGNVGDLGATQTGSTPPGPPPLPGPTLPAIGTPFVAGQATVSGSDTLVIPITADIPRSDPSGGGTVILVFVHVPSDYTGNYVGTTDDASEDPFYGTCIFADGLNHYVLGGGLSGPVFGLVMNEMANGENNITVQLDTAADFIVGTVFVFTAVRVNAVNSQDESLTWLLSTTDPGAFQASEKLGGGVLAGSVGWLWPLGGTLHIVSPSGANTDENWEWLAGVLAFYIVSDNTETSDEIGWTWADGSIVDYYQYDILGSDGKYYSFALGLQTPPPTLAAGPSLDGAWGSGANLLFTGGFGYSMVSGPGPSCTTPPPSGGVPIFNNHIRLSE